MTAIAPIAPFDAADIINGATSYNLFFAEGVLTREYYAKFWFASEAPVRVMDCLVHEKAPLPSPEELVIAARLSRPTHICVPDVLRDGNATLRLFLQYARALQEVPCELIAVPHGLSREALIENALRLSAYTNYIGLNPGIKNELGLCRGDIARELHSMEPSLHFHMLGIAKDGFDFAPCSYIMGVDSARPVYQGVVGSGIIDRPVHYLEWSRWLVAQYIKQINSRIHDWNGLLHAMSTESQA